MSGVGSRELKPTPKSSWELRGVFSNAFFRIYSLCSIEYLHSVIRYGILIVFTKQISILLVGLNELMESKGGKKKSSSSSKSLFYEAPLGYSIEDIRPNGGIKKFRSAAYSNCARKPS
ncbi:hypothetical protein VNO78_09597 [Psophocarpus tetragonolobus]|uniref:Uncharacterized protein n=1 Tax=Psophocarpus tetragonolobus TaxID=3891 RepID=A0AAN9SZI0_PSOTE